ncbi:hypothetical protein IWZ00DRAFT_491609 [Phyllosticta capitalensis]
MGLHAVHTFRVNSRLDFMPQMTFSLPLLSPQSQSQSSYSPTSSSLLFILLSCVGTEPNSDRLHSPTSLNLTPQDARQGNGKADEAVRSYPFHLYRSRALTDHNQRPPEVYAPSTPAQITKDYPLWPRLRPPPKYHVPDPQPEPEPEGELPELTSHGATSRRRPPGPAGKPGKCSNAPSHTTDTGVLSASTKTVDHCLASPLEATHHSIPVVATLSHQPTTPINGDNPASQDSQASPEPSESLIRLFFCVGRSIQNGERSDDPEALSVWTVTRRHAIPPGQRSEALKKQLRHANERVVAEVSVFSRDEMGYASGRLVEKRQLLALYATQMDWEDFFMESVTNGWKNIIGDRM